MSQDQERSGYSSTMSDSFSSSDEKSDSSNTPPPYDAMTFFTSKSHTTLSEDDYVTATPSNGRKALTVAGTSFLWEHLARLYGCRIRPTTFINTIAAYVRPFMTHIGQWMAWISNYLRFLHVDEFVVTASDLTRSVTSLTASFFAWIKGYCSYADGNMKIYLGSVGIFFMFMLLVRTAHNRKWGKRLCPFVDSKN